MPKHIFNKLSVRLSMMVVFAMVILLMGALAVMLHYSREAVKEEAMQKAAQRLEGTVQHIDNLLLSVEQAAGNMYFNVFPHLKQPEFLLQSCRKLVENNPCVAGCAIAFKPYYYKDREYTMIYVFRSGNDSLSYTHSPIIQAETYGNCPYTEQVWFKHSMETKKISWMDPIRSEEIGGEPITTFCLPIFDYNGGTVGVIGVDLSLSQFSDIVLSAKPSPNSYCTLLTGEGSYIIHPDSNKLYHQTVFTQITEDTDPSVEQAAKAMISGETGYKPFRMNGTDYYVFYKPFERASMPERVMEKLNWSAGIIYPEEDIFGDYNRLIYYVLAISLIGLLLLFLLCQTIMHRQLKPLRLLTKSAQRIAQGNYNEPIPDSNQHDEIGRLQNHFQQMQQSLATNVGELEQLTATLQQRGKELRVTYEKVKQADRMKTAFLHNMTDQMIGPATAIEQSVNALCDYDPSIAKESPDQLVDHIQQQGETIAEVLKNLLNLSEEEIRKEVENENP